MNMDTTPNFIAGRARIACVLLLGLLGLGTSSAHAANVTNSPGNLDRSTSGTFSLSVTHQAPATDSLCVVSLTVNAAFSAVDTVSVPTGWGASVAGNVITWTATDSSYCLYAPAADTTANFGWTATAPAGGGDYSSGWQVNGGLDSGTIQTHVNQPDLSTSSKMVNDANGAPLRPGDVLEYTIDVDNTGDMAAANVSVADTLPAEIASVANVIPAPTSQGGSPIVIVWDFATIAAGGGQTITFDATLDSPVDNGTAISNDATVTADGLNPVLAGPVSLAVTSSPDFATVIKTVTDLNGGQAQPGDTLLFTVRVPNTGDMDATGVRVFDTLPTTAIDYVPSSTQLNGVPVADIGVLSPVEVAPGLLVNSPGRPGGEVAASDSAVVTLRMRIQDDAPPGTDIDNTADVSSDQGASGSSSSATISLGGADHTVLVSPDATASTCDTVSYIIQFVPATSSAFDVYLEVTPGADLSYVAGSTVVTNSGVGGTDTSDPLLAGGLWSFNVDGGGPNPGDLSQWDVVPGDTITVLFSMTVDGCSPGARQMSTTGFYQAGASAPYSFIAPSSNSVIDVEEGALIVEKVPVAPSASLGDTVTYTINVESTGFGAVGNVTVTDELEAGLRLVAGLTSPAPTSVVMNPDSTTTIVWDGTVSGLDRIESGNSTAITLAVQLVACENYDDTVVATWGCGAEPCQTVEATASVNLILDEPALVFDITPDPISIASCDPAGTGVTFTVTNNGGPARDMSLLMNGLDPAIVISNLSGATFSPGSPDTFHVGDLEGGDAVVITFDLTHNDTCYVPGGNLVFSAEYVNDCGDPYSFTSLITSYSTSSLPSVSIDKSGPIEVLYGDTTQFVLDICFTDGPPADTVFVDDVVPGFLTFLGATRAPDAVAGGNVSWFLLPGEFPAGAPSCLQITYDVEGTGACGSVGANNASAMTSVACGTVFCTSSSSANVPTSLDCPPDSTLGPPGDAPAAGCFDEFTHTVDGSASTTTEVCTPMTHRVSFTFGSSVDPGLLFSNLMLTLDTTGDKSLLGYRQVDSTYVPGVARFTVEDSAGNSCVLDIEAIRNGSDELEWDLTALDDISDEADCGVSFTSLVGATVTAEFDLTSPTPLGFHFEFARLAVSGTATCDGTLREPVQVTVGRSSMTATLDVPTTVDRCAPLSLDLTVSKSGAYASYDNVLYLSTDDFEYIDDPADPDFFEPVFTGLPNVGVPTRVSDVGNGSPGVMWLLGDLPAGFTSGTITVPLRKRCEDASSYVRIVYDDKCGDDDTNNVDENPLSSTSTTSAVLVFAADVSLELTPETYFADSDTASWTLYAINGGTGSAYGLTVDFATPGTSLEWIGFELFDNAGDPVPGGLTVTYGPGETSASLLFPTVPAGETWSVTAQAVLRDCVDPTISVSGWWGCEGSVCQDGPQLADAAAVDVPEALVIAALPDSFVVGSCEVDSLSVLVRNASSIASRDVAFSLDLPPGLSYVAGSTRIRITHDAALVPAVLTPSGADADPAVNGNRLTWFLNDHLSDPFLSPGDELEIVVDLAATSTYAGGTLSGSGEYRNECGAERLIVADQTQATSNALDPAGVTMSGVVDSLQTCTVDGTDANTVLLTFDNAAGNGSLYGVATLQVALPEGVSYVAGSSTVAYPTSGAPGAINSNPSTSGTGAPGDPQLLSWSIPSSLQLDGGDAITVDIRLVHRTDGACDGSLVLQGDLSGWRCAPSASGNTPVDLGPFPVAIPLLPPTLLVDASVRDLTGTGGISPGDTLEFVAAIANQGTGLSRSPELVLSWDPATVTLLSASPAADASSASTATFNAGLGVLAPGDADTVVVRVRVNQNVAQGSVFAVDAALTDGCCGDETTDRETAVVLGAPILDIEKVAAQSVIIPGQYVTYNVLVRNNGDQAFQNVAVTETPTLPGLTFVSSEFDSANVAYTPSGSDPVWTIASTVDGQPAFAPGAAEMIRLTYLVDADYTGVGTPAGSGSVANTIAITSVESTTGAPVTAPAVLDTDTELLPVTVQGAALHLQKYGIQGQVVPGELISYVLRVTNQGDQELTSVTVTDTIPAGMTFVQSQFDTSAVTETATAPPTYSISTLPVHGTQDIVLTFRASANANDLGATATNIASAAGTDEGGSAVSAPDASTTLSVVAGTGALEVDKVSLGDAVVTGQDVTYLVTVSNVGDVPLTNVAVTDAVPAGLTFSSASTPGDVTFSPAPPTWTIPVLEVGEDETFSITFTAAADSTGLDNPTVNIVTAAGSDPSGNAIAAVPDSASLPVQIPAAGLDLDKVATSGVAVPGNPITYHLLVTNSGNVDLTNVTVNDTAPAGLTFDAAQFDSTVTQPVPSVPQFLIASLPAGAAELIALTFDVPADTAGIADPVVNTADASASDPSGNPIAAQDATSSVPLGQAGPALEVDKVSLGDAVVTGQDVTYLVTVSNVGDVPLTNVAVTDAVPAGLTFSSASTPGDVTFSPAPPTWTIPVLEVGEDETFSITFTAAADSTGLDNPTVNIVTAAGSDPSGNAIAAVPDSASLPVQIPAAGLDLDKVATSGVAVPGNPITYHLLVTNSGNVDLTNVTVNDTAPAGLTFDAAQFDSTVTQPVPSVPQFLIASLPAGAAELIALTFDVPADTAGIADPVVNTADASASDPSGNPIAAQDATSSVPLGQAGPALEVDKVSLGDAVVTGQDVTYLVTVSNVGDVPLTNVAVTDAVPAGLTFSSASTPGDVTFSPAPPTWTIPVLEVGEDETFSITFTAAADSTGLDNPTVNIVTAAGSDPSGNAIAAVPDSASLPVQIPAAGLDLDKVATSGVAVPGNPITYHLLVTNSGNVDLTNVTVNDTAPAGLTFDAAQFDSTVTQPVPSVPQFLIASLPAGAAELIALTFDVPADTAGIADPVVNTADASASDPSGNPIAAQDATSSVPLGQAGPALEVDKVSLGDAVVTGQDVTYLVTVSNVGDVPLTNVAVTDAVPAGLTFSSASTPGDVTFSPAPPTWTIPVLEVGEDETFSITFTAAADSTGLDNPTVNIVTAAGSDPSGNAIAAVPDSASLPVQIPAAGLDLDKVATSGVAVPGNPITYHVTVTNPGGVEITGITVADLAPAGLTFDSAQFDSSVTQPDPAQPVFSIASLAPGGFELIALTFDVPADTALYADPVVNQATASGSDPSGNVIQAQTATSSVPVSTPGSGLTVQKLATESFALPGGSLTYWLSVTNTGDLDLTQVDLVDLVPAGMTFAYSQFDPARVTETSTAPPTYRIALLEAHETERIGLTFALSENPDDLTDPVINRAVAAGLDPSGTAVVSDTTDASIPQVDPGPSVQVQKTPLTTGFTAGELGHYLITVSNTGGTPLSGISVTDFLPAGMTFVASEPAPTSQPTPVVWSVPDLATGESHQILLTVLSDYTLSGTVTNTAAVSAVAPGDSTVGDSDDAVVDVQAGTSSINLQKTPTSGFLLLGGQITYILTVTNDGDQPLTGISVADSIPLGTTFAGSDLDPARWDLAATAPEAVWNLIGDLGPGQSEQITLVLDGSTDLSDFGLSGGDTTLVNTARVSSTDPQGAPVTDRDTGIVEIHIPRGAVLLNKVAAAGQIVPGEQITYVLTVENIGDQDLFPMEVREPDLLDQGLTYIASDFDSTIFVYSFDGVNHLWTVTAPYVPDRQSQIRVTFEATTDLALLADPVINVASVVGTDENGELVTDTDSEGLPLNVLRSGLSVNKTSSAGAVIPGGLVDYTLTISNTGEIPILDVVVTESDLVDQGLVLYGTNFDPTAFVEVDSLTWSAADTLLPGQTEEIRISYRALNGIPAVTDSVVNTVTVTGTDLFNRDLVDTASEGLPVLLPYTSIKAQKVALQSAAVTGDIITYLLTVTNNGDQDLTGVTVSDVLPAGVTYESSEYDTDRLTFTGTPAAPMWTVTGTLGRADFETIRLTVAVDEDPILVDDPVVNRMSASGTDPSGNVVTDEDEDLLPLQLPFRALSISKLAVETVIVPGEQILYHLLIENRGNTPLSDVLVTDTPPAGLTYRSSDFETGEVSQTSTDPVAPAWLIDELPIGTSQIISVWFDADPDPTRIDNPAVNRAEAEGTDAAGVSASATTEAELPVQTRDASVALEKFSLESTAIPGAPISYEIRATNTGSDTLFQAVITDPPPVGLSFADATFDQDQAVLSAGPPVTWTLTQPFPPGAVFSTRVTFDVDGTAGAVADPVVNTATITSLNSAGDPVTDQATDTVPLETSDPAIHIEKSTTAAVVIPGGTVAYILTVTNTGNRDLVGVVVEDIVPDGLTYTGSSFDATSVAFSGSDGAPAWTIGALERGGVEAISVRFAVDADPRTIPDPVVNTAQVSGADGFGNAVADADDESTPVQVPTSSLNLDKVATRGALTPGEEVTYILTVFNNGSTPLTQVTVDDLPPVEWEYQGSSFDAVHVQETTVADPSWLIPNLPAGGFEQIRVTFHLPEDVTYPDTLVNRAETRGTDPGGVVLQDEAQEVLPLALATPAIHVDINATRDKIVPGDPATYHVTLANTGSVDLVDVDLVVTPPPGLSYRHGSVDDSRLRENMEDGVLRWTLDSFPHGDVEELRVSFDVDQTLTAGNAPNEDGWLANQALVSGWTLAGVQVIDSDDDRLPVEPDPSSIQILKWTDFTGDAAYKGVEVAYHLFVVNTGQQHLSDVTVTDHLPAELTFVEADQTIFSSPAGPDGGNVTWAVGDLAPQEGWEVLLVGRMAKSVQSSTVIANRAVATGLDEAGTLVRDEDTARFRALLPTVTLQKTADRNQARPGDVVTYQLSASNPGHVEAREVTVTDGVPDGTRYVSGSATNGAVYQPDSETIVLDQGILTPGASTVFTYQVRIDDDAPVPGRIPNVASLFAAGLDPVESDTVWVELTDTEVALRKAVSRSVAQTGDTLTYTLRAESFGPDIARDVVVRDAVPGLTEYVPGSAFGAEVVYEPGTRTLAFALGDLTVGEGRTVTYRAVISASAPVGAAIENTAELVVGADDPLPSNRVVTLIEAQGGIRLIKRVSHELASPGDTLSYELVATNATERPLTAVSILDTPPAEVHVLDNSWGDGQLVNGGLEWTLGTLLPGESRTVAFRAVVDDDVASGTTIANTGAARSRETGEAISNTVQTLVLYTDLEITKQASPATARPGDQITYTVRMINRGNAAAEDVLLVDEPPFGFEYVAGSTDITRNGDAVPTSEPVRTEALEWTLGSMRPQDVIVVTYRTRVTSDVQEGVHVNRAVVRGRNVDGSPLQDGPAEAPVAVETPNLTITKITPERTVEEGSMVLYTITVQNSSKTPALNVWIEDTTPPGFHFIPGSAQLNGMPVPDPEGYAPYRWFVGDVVAGQDQVLTYALITGLNAASGVAINRAVAVGEDPVGGELRVGPAEARVNVVRTGDIARVRGWVYMDCNDDGDADSGDWARSGVPGVRLLLEDGRRVTTDANGEYFIWPIPSGDHLIQVDVLETPDDIRVVGDAHRFFYALGGGEARVNFRVCRVEESEAVLHLAKEVDTPLVERRVVSEEPERFVLEGIHFDTGRATLRAGADRMLLAAAERLREVPDATARIEGHTDDRNIRTAEFRDNYDLSVARADAVRSALVSQHGIDPARLDILGFGPDRPVATGRDPESLQQNRRVEILIYAHDPPSDEGAEYVPQVLHYRLTAQVNGDVAMRNAALVDSLPDGLSFIPGSVMVNGLPAGDPVLDPTDGGTRLRWQLGDLTEPLQYTVDYQAEVVYLEEGVPSVNRGAFVWEDSEGAVRTAVVAAPVQLLGERSEQTIRFNLDSVLFETAKADLRPAARAMLAEVTRTVEDLTSGTVTVEGHTDSRPIRTPDYPDNLALSRARARSVRDYLIESAGLDPSVISATGYGATRPVAGNDTVQGRQRNRRVVITVRGTLSRWNQGTILETESSPPGSVEVRVRSGVAAVTVPTSEE